jgi:alpha-ribazole phosphatase
MNKQLYLLRHGATGRPGLYIGSTDIPLAEEGKEQVMQTGRLLALECIDHIYCSPMKRCRETLNLLHLNASFEIDENVREIDFGRWEGRSFEEISHTDNALVENWRIDGESFCFPEGESVKSFNKRVEIFAKRLLAGPGNKILILAHGGTIRHLLCTFLDLSPEKRIIFDVQTASFSTLTLYDDKGILTSFNVKG